MNWQRQCNQFGPELGQAAMLCIRARCLCADKRTYKRRSGIRNRLATSRAAAAGCRARDTYHAARDAKNNATRWRRRRRASAGPPGWWLSSTGAGGGGDLWAGEGGGDVEPDLHTSCRRPLTSWPPGVAAGRRLVPRLETKNVPEMLKRSRVRLPRRLAPLKQ